MKILDKNIIKVIKMTFAHPKTLSIALLLTLINSASMPVSFWLFSLVIDGLTAPQKDFQTLILLAAGSVIVQGLGIVGNNLSYTYIERLSLRVYHDLFETSYDRIVRANISRDNERDYHTAFASAKAWVEDIIAMMIQIIMGFVFEFLVAATIIGLNFGWKYLVIIFGLAVLPTIFYAPFAKRVRTLNVEAHDSTLKINRNLSQIIDNLSLISSYQTRRYEKRYAEKGYSGYQSNQMKLAKGYLGFNILRTSINSAIFISLLAILIRDVFNGQVGVGQVFLFYTYMDEFVGMFSNLPLYYLRMQRRVTQISPLLEADQLTIDVEDQEPQKFPEIDRLIVSGYQCSYLPDLDPKTVYEFQQGKIYWLKGENGAGKSTLLKAMMGLSREAQADVQIEWQGERHQLSPNDRAFNFAYASQEALIWEREVKDNLEYAAHGDFGGHSDKDFANHLSAKPAFTKISLDADSDDLSGGQKQLIHVYRALGKNAPVLLLDEPTNALDGDVILELITSLQKRVPHAIIIMATHSEFLQKIANETVEIKRL